MDENMLTVSDVAQYLKVSNMTIYRLVDREMIEHVRVGGQLRFKKEWIDSYIAGLQGEHESSVA